MRLHGLNQRSTTADVIGSATASRQLNPLHRGAVIKVNEELAGIAVEPELVLKRRGRRGIEEVYGGSAESGAAE